MSQGMEGNPIERLRVSGLRIRVLGLRFRV